jgi:hypothetical protein
VNVHTLPNYLKLRSPTINFARRSRPWGWWIWAQRTYQSHMSAPIPIILVGTLVDLCAARFRELGQSFLSDQVI